MKAAKWLASFMIGAIILFVSLYFVISLCVTFFKLTGRIVENQPMFFDLQTPTWASLFIFQVACIAILAAGFFLRHRLRGCCEQPQ